VREEKGEKEKEEKTKRKKKEKGKEKKEKEKEKKEKEKEHKKKRGYKRKKKQFLLQDMSLSAIHLPFFIHLSFLSISLHYFINAVFPPSSPTILLSICTFVGSSNRSHSFLLLLQLT
jgi:cation transport ATPase